MRAAKTLIPVLVFLLVISMAVARTAPKPSILEQQYGTNLVRIVQQAEVEWVRDNAYIIYSEASHRNHYVSMLGDDDITHILKHPLSRERVGIDEANLQPYVREVAGEVPPQLSNFSNRGIVEERKPEPEKEEPSRPAIGQDRVDCVRQNRITIFDPLYRSNRWASQLSDGQISRILQKNSVIGC